jgi:hypothetical protein
MTKRLIAATIALVFLIGLPSVAQEGDDYVPNLLRLMAREGWDGDVGEMEGLLNRYRATQGPLADPQIVAFALGAALRSRGQMTPPQMAQLAWGVAAGGGEMGAYGYEDRQVATAMAKTVRSVARQRIGWQESGVDVGEEIRAQIRQQLREQIRLQEPCGACGASGSSGTQARTQTQSKAQQGGSGSGGGRGPGGPGSPGSAGQGGKNG